MNCAVCKSAMRAEVTSWHGACRSCGYENATFAPTINDSSAHEAVDESRREDGLRLLRTENFKVVLSHIEAAGRFQKPARLLDVGCAHGWFLKEASARFSVLGLEPDEYIAQQTIQDGLPVRTGYFPDVLHEDETFDVIVFNDVFEHLPDVHAAMRACHAHLAPSGLLVLNLPSSRGFFYRLAKLMARFSMKGPFERMWQKDLPSPHLHYFGPDNLAKLAAQFGFQLNREFHLDTIKLDGLWPRLRFVKGTPVLLSAIQYLFIAALIPVLSVLPKDAHVAIFQKL